jgi:hypothetical protein
MVWIREGYASRHSKADAAGKRRIWGEYNERMRVREEAREEPSEEPRARVRKKRKHREPRQRSPFNLGGFMHSMARL